MLKLLHYVGFESFDMYQSVQVTVVAGEPVEIQFKVKNEP